MRKNQTSNQYNIGSSHLFQLTVCIFFSAFFLFLSCEQKTEYERRVEAELSKNTRADSLFLGYTFGMTSQEFFKYSWDLNSRGIITGQATVNYKIENLKSSASMDFYPQFKNDKIYKMPIQVQYDGWAPWNKNLFADSLMLDLVDLYEQKYDGEFFKAIHPETKKEAYINIQSNRRISIFKNDDRIVNVEFFDLSSVENNL